MLAGCDGVEQDGRVGEQVVMWERERERERVVETQKHKSASPTTCTNARHNTVTFMNRFALCDE